MKATLLERIKGYLSKRTEDGNLRQLTIENDLVDFCSNDYLGFARSAALESDIHEAVKQCPLPVNGSSGSRLITGNYSLTEEVESSIAAYHNAETALLYNSGYDANVGFFSCVPRKGDTILYDELVHASIHDGMRLSKATCVSFLHNDVNDLAAKILTSEGQVFIAVESVYSMDGDMAPLKEICALITSMEQAHLVVDEAHGTGVIGKKGIGLVADLGLEQQVLARIHTYGKAHGVHGAAILGNSILRDYLINFSRSFIYTTAMPLHSILAINCSYRYLETNSTSLTQLKHNINLFKSLLCETSLQSYLIPSSSAIQSLVVPGNEIAKKMALEAWENGLYVKAILAPTVPKGKERLRICLHSYNTGLEIKALIKSISIHL